MLVIILSTKDHDELFVIMKIIESGKDWNCDKITSVAQRESHFDIDHLYLFPNSRYTFFFLVIPECIT